MKEENSILVIGFLICFILTISNGIVFSYSGNMEGGSFNAGDSGIISSSPTNDNIEVVKDDSEAELDGESDNEVTTEEFSSEIEGDGVTVHLHVKLVRENGKVIKKIIDGHKEGTDKDGNNFFKRFKRTVDMTYDNLGRVKKQEIESWDGDLESWSNTTVINYYDGGTNPVKVETMTEDANGNTTTSVKTDIQYENKKMVSWHEKITTENDDIVTEKDVDVKRDPNTGLVIERHEVGTESGTDEDGNHYERDFERTINYSYDNLRRVKKEEITSWDSESNRTTNVTRRKEYSPGKWFGLASTIISRMEVEGHSGRKVEYIYDRDKTGAVTEKDKNCTGDLGCNW